MPTPRDLLSGLPTGRVDRRVDRRLVPLRPGALAFNLAAMVLTLGTVTVASVAGVASTRLGVPAAGAPPPPAPAWAPGWTADALALLMVLAATATIALLAAVMLPGRRRRKRDEPERVIERPPLSAAQRVAVASLPLAALGLFAVIVVAARQVGTGPDQAPAPSTAVTHAGAEPTRPAPAGERPAGPPASAARPTLILLATALTAIALAALLAWLLVHRRPHPQATTTAATARSGKVVPAAADDPRRIADPRRAIVAAYARMEADLGARGLGRDPTEAPLEYLDRIHPALSGVGDSGAGDASKDLTETFELARFSRHEITAALRNRAIGALDQLRGQLGNRGPTR